MNHTIGYVIIVLSVVLGGATLFSGWLQWRKNLPKDRVRDMLIRYLPDSVKPWNNLPEAIDAMRNTLRAKYPACSADLLDTWIEVVPYSGVCTSETVPRGYERDDQGKYTKRVTGTVRLERCMGIGPKHQVIVVRQLREGDSPSENDNALGTGKLRSAGSSALFHEMCHLTSYLAKNSWNTDHKDPEMLALENEMASSYARMLNQEAVPVQGTCYRCEVPKT